MKTYEQFTKVSYSCVLLDPESHFLLEQLYCYDLTNDWKIYCHHMTLCLGELPTELKSRIGEEIQLKVVAVGQDDKAFAVKVIPLDEQLQSFKPKSGPKFYHITMAINLLNGGKPVMSNNIQDWIDVKELSNEEVLLTGKITEIRN